VFQGCWGCQGVFRVSFCVRNGSGSAEKWTSVSPWCLGPAPAAAAVQLQGLGWKSKCGRGRAVQVEPMNSTVKAPGTKRLIV